MPQGERVGLLIVATGVFMLSLDVTMLDIVLSDMAAALDADQTQLSWIADCYNVALAGLILLGAGLGGRFGQRRVYLAGLVVFGIGGVAAGAAAGPAALIFGRTLMGIGAAGMAAPAVALTGIMYPGEQRTRALATWAAASGIGLAVGPIVGGLIITMADWRWIFFVPIPFVVVMAVAGRTRLPRGADRDPAPLDLPGAALSASALIPLVAALLQIPDAGWADGWVPAGIALGVALLAAFVVRELHTSSPMIDLRVLRLPPVGAAALALAASYVGFLGLQFLGAIQLRSTFALDAVRAGLVLTPWAVLYWLGARCAARLVARIAPTRVIAVGLAVLCLSFALLAATSPYGPAWVGAGLAAAGVGCGFITPVAVSLMLSATPESLLSTSSGLSMVVRYGGGAIGLAVCAAAAALGGASWGYVAGGVLVVITSLGVGLLMYRRPAS